MSADDGTPYRPEIVNIPMNRTAAGLRRDGQATVMLVVEVDVLDGVEQLDALGHRPLERLAARDQAHAAGPLVDDGGAHGVGQVAGALGLAAAVDEPDAAHVAVGDLPAGEVDRVVGGELVVDQRRGLAVASSAL